MLSHALLGRPVMVVPSMQISPLTPALRGSIPMTARQIAVFPEPDSPTIASVRPAVSSKQSDSTARVPSFCPRYVTERSLTLKMSASDAPSHTDNPRDAAICGLPLFPEGTQPLAQDIEGQHRQE